MAPDADREPPVQPRVTAGGRPLHQEVPLPIAEHEVRDDLLERRIALHLRARLVSPVALDGGHEVVQPVGSQAVPACLVGQRLTRNDIDALVGHGALLEAGPRGRQPLADRRLIGRFQLTPPARQRRLEREKLLAQRRSVRDGDPRPHRRIAAGESSHVAPS